MTKNHKYKFSIVTAVYNTQEYVSDAIDSVINQSIGFEDNIQLILVNDGSTDKSGEICKKYKKLYPKNIVYIKQRNKGVSSARNRGLRKVKGKYVNFLDSDDKLSKNTLEEVWTFFEKRYDEIDFVSIPMYFFGISQGQHIMNWKFTDTEIIDINKKPQYIQLSSCSSIFKSSTIKQYKFDTKLKYAEDVKILNQILFEKQKFGILNTAKYLYRKRDSSDSAMNQTTSSKNWYFNALEDSFFYLLKTSKKKFGKTPKYYQYLAMYDLQFRLKQKDMALLDEKEKKRYLSMIKQMLQYIDDDVIFDQRFYFQEQKAFALALKYNQSIKKIGTEFKVKNGELYFRGTRFPRKRKLKLNIKNFNIEDNILIIEGIIKTIFPMENLNISVQTLNKRISIKPIRYRHVDVMGLEKRILKGYAFKIQIPIFQEDKIKFFTKLNGKDISTYYYFGKGLESNYIVNRKIKKIFLFDEKQISIKKYSVKKHVFCELNYYKRLLGKDKKEIILTRLLYRFFKILKLRKLWLFIERPTAGGDNAQAFFEYASKQTDNIKKIFIIAKDSSDYSKIRSIGRVVPWESKRHLMYFLLSDTLISSHADEFIINPFNNDRKYFYDLLNFDFIFLQHGIIKDDLSNWLNKINKNIRLFITSAKPEYNSILKYDYLYSKKEVLLSGLPRYDKLINHPCQKILVMPTWRKFLSTEVNGSDLTKDNKDFSNTDFYKFYNRLITNPKLLDIINKMGYKIKLCLHPAMINKVAFFKDSKYVEISKEICNYNKEFSEGSLLITDYSSVAFDFAYLRKPVIYSQFDYKEVFSNHIYEEGYFSYKDDGFGPVCEDLDCTIKNIIKVLENGCKLEKKYRDRIDGFFEYNDKKNCERVYEAIRNL
jgi:CDP-glycerol glycerophosphotransferase (TagB/SpsB family)/glycosyltransferase involved in cell wall biosynthesis